MALTANRFVLEVTFIDRGGKSVKRTYALRESAGTNDISSLRTSCISIVTTLSNISECKVASWRLTLEYVEAALVLPSSADAEAETQLLLVAPSATTNKAVTLSVPGPKASIFYATSGPRADIANVTVGSYPNALLKFFDAAEYNVLRISDGETLVSSRGKGHRKHRASKQG